MTTFATAAAVASPIDDKRAQARRLQQQIDANGDRIAVLGEQYNGAVLHMQEANAAVAEAEQRMAAAKKESGRLESLVAERAAALYRNAGNSKTVLDTDAATVNELNVKSKYSALATDTDETLINNLAGAQQDLDIERQAFEKRRDDAKAVSESLAATQDSIEKANATQERLLGRVQGELATLVAQEQARKLEAARRETQRRLVDAQRAQRPPGVGASPAVDRVRSIPPRWAAPPCRTRPHRRVASARCIAYAQSQIGKPYHYAAVGPDSFDCSGLTMQAWREGGVFMGHYSGSQYASFPKVSLGELQPGDLVFRGAGGSAHVALYVGGGMVIEATHTGDYVRMQPMGRVMGASRPG